MKAVMKKVVLHRYAPLVLWLATLPVMAQEKAFWGHRASINAVAIHSTGRYVFSASSDKSVAVWDTAGSRPLLRFSEHKSAVLSLALSPDGQLVASGGADGLIYVWHRASGRILSTLKGHTNAVSGLAFSPDGKRLASSSWDRAIRVWDWSNSTTLAKLTGHQALVLAVAFGPDGKHVASGSADSTARVWDWQANRTLATLTGHDRAVRAVTFDPTGQKLITGSSDFTIRVWNWQSGATEQTLSGHTSIVRSVTVSADGRLIASGSDDGTVRVWDAATGKLQKTLTGHSAAVSSVSFGAARQLVSGGVDQSLRIWPDRPGRTVAGSGAITRVVWTQPNPLLYQNRTHIASSPTLYLQATVLAAANPTELRQSLRLYLNGKPLPEGDKMGETKLKHHEQEFLVERTINLPDGSDTLEWAVQLPNQKEVRSRQLIVNYTPANKPNLYVYAFGVESNLRYTQNDAESIARIFKTQQGRLFDRVSVELFAKEQTKAGDLREELERLGNRGDVIRPQDVVMLFVSGHGIIKNNDFRILGRSYSDNAWRSSSISYRDDIIANLNNLTCKKVVLLDACHSGGISMPEGSKAAVDVADAGRLIADAPPGLAVVSSSGQNELSYENEAWQNGAFTEAISEALEQGKADANRDAVVTVQELYQYLQTRVPDLVRTVLQQDQHPQFKPGESGDFPVFYLTDKTPELGATPTGATPAVTTPAAVPVPAGQTGVDRKPEPNRTQKSRRY
ncbi:hypothetical protein DYU11_29640 [Fibrisoma montanum]|uniref:Peptidase C14 caspase domain-containing protein n=2 Tax=Fibrisoma montanum TaxID=2305895 RepID=A0A418LXL7_9BACT|nr:hypothetical protein DYU11_29640 [Fibrisoma montanum]